jgi:pilus assembly protein Flp/PilA
MKNTVAKFARDESGATAIEYGLIASAMGLTLVATMPGLNDAVSATFGQIAGFFAGT